ncbi:PHP domain-containing protein [Kineococcus sp. NUM-3379]
MRIDLHAHSSASDGTQPPADVVASAAAEGLDVVALTDHDTTSGWAEATAAGERLGVRVVPGTEISCRADGVSVHLLSYLHDPAAPALAESMLDGRTSRVHRARLMTERLGPETGITWEDVLAQTSEGATIGRPHIADALVAAGIVPDRQTAFETWLSARGRFFVPHTAPDPVEAVALVRAAGGVPVFAHPMASARGSCVSVAVIEAMAEAGLAGLEVEHRDHADSERRTLRDVARRLGLFTTGSSDYHGTGKPNRLGENTTDPEVLERLLAAAVPVPRP